MVMVLNGNHKSGDGGRVEGVCIYRNFWRKIFNVVTIKKDENIWTD